MNDELNPKDTGGRQSDKLDQMIRSSDTGNMSRARSQLREKAKKPGSGIFGFLFIFSLFLSGAVYFLTKNNVNIPFVSDFILRTEAQLIPIFARLSSDQHKKPKAVPGQEITPAILMSPEIPSAIPSKSVLKARKRARSKQATVSTKGKKVISTHESSIKANNKSFVDLSRLANVRGLIKGSLQSQFSSKNLKNSAVTYPDQVITFQTTLYTPKEVSVSAIQIAKTLGMKVIGIPIQDYDKGGASVFKITDSKTGLVFLAVKYSDNASKTSWRLDYYRL
ncbi:MAG: hypothetical protein SFT81_07205 [Candidatus Caenarcaniphilales bacterium]|nr:hypothetical protein [Candidatus Caenarcaniphilales bacterium]